VSGDDPQEQRIARAFDAWFAYVQTHPYAWKMLFHDTTGEPDVRAVHSEIRMQSRAALLPLLAEELGTEGSGGPVEADALEMAWELLRSALQGLALWWHDHQYIPRSQVVATAMSGLWIGLERVRRGEHWQP